MHRLGELQIYPSSSIYYVCIMAIFLGKHIKFLNDEVNIKMTIFFGALKNGNYSE